MLSGGTTRAGAVVRRGEIVDRPAQPHAPAIHRFLKASLPEHGFTGAPKPIGLSHAREQLEAPHSTPGQNPDTGAVQSEDSPATAIEQPTPDNLRR